jgi:D-aminopeptidase
VSIDALRPVALAAALVVVVQDPQNAAARARPRDLGVVVGVLPAGANDRITDVPGVTVGHCTVRIGDDVATGVTIVRPHGGNLFRQKVPAAVAVANGFGKLAGSTQVVELGELETPIALTGTRSVGVVVDALVEWTMAQAGNGAVQSVNAVVGETNDGWLSDARGSHVTAAHVRAALDDAKVAFEGGSVGAGTGTRCFGWKGGIGTASRRVSDHVVGVLVQTNFGGRLSVCGVPIPGPDAEVSRGVGGGESRDGSCMIVIATDAPMCARNLRRLAERAFAGMARTGASFSNGSGDYAIAFSTAESQRIDIDAKSSTTGGAVVRNERMTPYFEAAAEATEAAIVDALFRAGDARGRDGRSVRGLPVDDVVRRVREVRGK